ncbi:uncharacterized protein BN467_01693 [Prevotella sp. CAG:1124]|nr:uncharacterized protein BN467_01693 [Prevotella sp. CAG:1124]
MVSRSMTLPVDRRMFSTASLSIDKVLSPRKSIFISPVSSITLPSYCVQSSLWPVSLSSAVDTGTQSLIGSLHMIVPQAWIPVFLTFPSSILAYSMVSCRRGSVDASASRSSLTHLMAFVRFIFRPSGSLSGMALHSLFDSSRGSFSTRATSLMASLVAIVPYVMMCATLSAPYFWVTQSSTFPRPSSSKSVSISGSEIRSGLRNRSNSRSYFMGSIFVMPRQ